ncbi:MAG TPA: branched-chain amino acid ABC transporter permease [Trebonia sp.]|nr:branched-chain amino acid ABC transporter permease [Trebonia sp.]
MQSFFQTLVSGLSFGAVYALVALGFSLVYRTMGLVNFAHGAVLMIGAYVASTFYLSARLPFAVAVPAAMIVTGAVGLVIERVLRPLENKDFDLMLIGTIGAGTVLDAVAILIWSSSGRGVPSPVQTAPFDIGGVRIPAYNVLVIGVTAAAMAVLTLFLQRTRHGAAMQAVAMDHEAATAVGIHVGRSNAISFAIGAALAALAGALVGPMLYVTPTMGDSLGIQGFAAAILGGFGSIPGAIVGGLGIGVIGSFAAQSFQGYSDLVTFVVFTVLVMIRPTGIFGERTVNRA